MLLRNLLRGLAVLVPLALSGNSAAVLAAQAPPSLTVEGSAFVLRLPDGRVLRGVELEGVTVYLDAGGNAAAPLKLASIMADEVYPDILLHDFQVPDDRGGWKPACEPDAYGDHRGFPVVLPADHPGRDNPITLTCVSGAVGKCARFGYRPWSQSDEGEELMPLHAACVRMVRADYCGDGQGHTKDGTAIDNYDDYGIQRRGVANDPSFVFEAGWTGQGAVCVHHTRWSDLLQREQLLEHCPALAAVVPCDESTARELGAIVFNTSQLLPVTTATAVLLTEKPE